MRKVTLVSIVLAACTAGIPLHAQESTAAIGRRLAADSGVRWAVHDTRHPLLGSIKFAVQEKDIATTVGKGKIFSLSYVSCQKTPEKIAIELTSAPSSAPASGLGPVDLPRLVCTTAGPQGGLVKSDLAASWEISALGDTLARGLSPAELRRCVSIDVLQNLALPAGWPQQSQRVALQITPYGKELDSVFAACGEAASFASEPGPPPRGPPAGARPAPAATPAPAKREEIEWKPARILAKGRSNVRAAPRLDSRVVIQLEPGTRILVQPAAPTWWKVKPASGASFTGFIRDDRFQLERGR